MAYYTKAGFHTEVPIDESSRNFLDTGKLAIAPEAHLLVGWYHKNSWPLELSILIVAASVHELLKGDDSLLG